VKHKLTLARAATLSRHAAELKTLDTQQEEIDKFAYLISRFAEKYLIADQIVLQPTGSDEIHENQSTEDREIEERLILRRDGLAAASEGPWDKQNVSPNFGIPLRKFVGR